MTKLTILMASCAVLFASVAVRAEDFKADLAGFEEVPSVSTPASGMFNAKYDKVNPIITYQLSYDNLQGDVTQSHIHFAQRGVSGSIVIWLCQTATNPAPAVVAAITPICPTSGSVTGAILMESVLASSGSQMIQAGELEEVIAAIRAGAAYVNVHSTVAPGGEIRGQIKK